MQQMSGHLNESVYTHSPVMVREIAEFLNLSQSSTMMDGTLGEGGHTEAYLQEFPHLTVYGIDQDPTIMAVAQKRLEPFGSRFVPILGNFRDIETIWQEKSLPSFDAVLLDLGISTFHFLTSKRGFSFNDDAPLDMRLNPNLTLTAHDIIHQFSEKDIAHIIRTYGEEPFAKRIARNLVEYRNHHTFQTAKEFADWIKTFLRPSRNSHLHPATRIFQGFRIYINTELDNLSRALEGILTCMTPLNSRIAVLSYHSLEDRIVKQWGTKESIACICPPRSPVCTCHHRPQVSWIVKSPLVPSEQEQHENPRSRSAKLRILQHL